MTDQTSRQNPYVGPRAFRTGEKLYGRDRELRELLDLLIAERIVMLHSPSGAGKSSLVQAGLIPLLEEEGFLVLPVARVNLEPPTSVKNAANFNRYIYSVLLSLEEPLPTEMQLPVEQLATLSLAEYLTQRPRAEDDPEADVLIFDQFEEILTIDPTDRAGKMIFFYQLGEALRDRSRWVLFSLREDFVAALAPYVRPVPTRFSTSYRLDLLNRSAARQAIRQPAQEAGVNFQDHTAQKLIDDLRRVLVQHPDGSMEEQLGPYVEPVQLQVVCYRLWAHLPDDASQITDDDLAAVGDVDQSLADYYAEKVHETAQQTATSERLIRQWVERKLVTEGGFRGQVLMGEEKSDGLDNQAIRLLEDAHLVRGEKRRGAIWFELAHDRLIKPVRTNNAAWYQSHLSLLQRQAMLWEQQDRSETLYLRGQALAEAEQWAADNPQELSEVDQEFLEACLELRAREEAAREAAERERRLKLEAAQQVAEAERLRAEEQAQAATRLRRRAYILGAVLIIAVAMAGLAFISWQASVRSEAVAQKNAATAQAASTLANDNAIRAEANAVTAEAARKLADDNAEIAAANAATAQAASTIAVAQQATAIYNAQVAKEQEAIARTQANLARSRELASLAQTFIKNNPPVNLLLSKEAVDIFETGQALDAMMKGLQRNLSRKAERYEQFIPRQDIDLFAVAANPDGRHIAWGGSGLIRAWDLDTQEQVWVRVNPGVTINALAYSPDGSFLVSGDSNGELGFWDSETGERIRNIPSNIQQINSLAFSPDGSTLAYGGITTGSDANLFTRNLESSELKGFRIRQGEIEELLSLAWSPDGNMLASGHRDRVVHIWDPATGLEIETLKDDIVENQLARIYEGPIRSLAFSPNGKWLATGADDVENTKNKTLLVWDTSAWTDQEPLIFPAPNEYGNLTVLSFSPDGQTLASGYESGATAIWNFNSQELNETLRDHTRAVQDLDFSQFEDTLLLVSISRDRTVALNNLVAMQSLHSLVSEGKGSWTRLAIDTDEKLNIVGNTANSLMMWDVDPSTSQESESELGITAADGEYYLNLDGTRLALVDDTGQIVVRDLVSNESFTIDVPTVKVNEVNAEGESTSSEQAGLVNGMAFSPDGDLLAGGMCSERRISVDPDSGEETDTCLNNDIVLWDITTGALQKRIPTNQSSAILSLAFNPQEPSTIAAGNRDSSIQFWNLDQSQAISLPLFGTGGPVTSMAFHQDGDIMVSGSENNLIAMWNINPPQLIGDPLVGSDGSVSGLALGQDHSQLYSASDQGTILVWDLAAWKEIACNLAERNLTQTEWGQFFPDEEYRATCEQYPLVTPSPPDTPSPTATPTPTPTP